MSRRCRRRWKQPSTLAIEASERRAVVPTKVVSDRGGSRTHTHEALDLAALPEFAYSAIQMAGPGVAPATEHGCPKAAERRALVFRDRAYEAPLGAGPPASFVIAGPGLEPGGPAL